MILYFSGTGNSRHIAVKLAQMIGEEKPVDMGSLIKKGRRGEFSSDRPYIFVVPTYGWRVPRIVSEFMAGSSFCGNRRAYFLLTCGSSIGNAGKYAAELCRTAGLEFWGCGELKMPENYVAMFAVPDEETSQRLVRSAEHTLKQLASKIERGEKLTEKRSLAGALESSIVNDIFYKVLVKDKGFRTTDRCIGCGVCKSLCPLNNIEMSAGRPEWQGNCTHCMACICRCPSEAIEYKNKSVGKRRYYLSE